MAIESKKGPTLLMAKFATCDYLISFMGQPFKDDAKKDAVQVCRAGSCALSFSKACPC